MKKSDKSVNSQPSRSRLIRKKKPQQQQQQPKLTQQEEQRKKSVVINIGGSASSRDEIETPLSESLLDSTDRVYTTEWLAESPEVRTCNVVINSTATTYKRLFKVYAYYDKVQEEGRRCIAHLKSINIKDSLGHPVIIASVNNEPSKEGDLDAAIRYTLASHSLAIGTFEGVQKCGERFLLQSQSLQCEMIANGCCGCLPICCCPFAITSIQIIGHKPESGLIGEMHHNWPENHNIFGLSFPKAMSGPVKQQLIIASLILNILYFNTNECWGYHSRYEVGTRGCESLIKCYAYGSIFIVLAIIGIVVYVQWLNGGFDGLF